MAFEYLKQYSTFESVEEMDNHVEQHIQQHYFNLTESERAIVFTIASRSLMYPGSSHLKASTIADAVEVSTKTVYRSIKRLVELGIIEKVAQTKLNGIKGASIYKILPYDVPTEMSERAVDDKTSNDAVCPPQSENQSLDSFNLLKSFKTSTLQEIYNNALAEKEAIKEYMNDYQMILFDFMHSLPLVDSFKDELHKLVLASEINSAQAFHKAKNVMVNLANDIAEGTLTISKTIRSVFVGAYNKAIERSNNTKYNTSIVEEEPHICKSVPFYDWLNEKPSDWKFIESKPVYLENWLEW
ncbi:helix-turn-helix domain-containing protein [Psychrobacillus sp. FSL K6-2843]|jgi:predicted transcriptional regulator|uniref:helix-turn-helix domain-containing protein n=1 Tax=Psychrobacillus sp. FSL K6-2843 TaxID=2921549 RepID=UPI00315A902F